MLMILINIQSFKLECSKIHSFLLQVEKILDKRKNKKGKLEYLVRWRGYGSEGDTWEPEGNLSTCMIYVHDFNRQYEHQRENILLRSTRRSPSHQSHRQPCTLLLASTAGAAGNIGKGAAVGSDQVEPAMGLTQPGLTTPTGPAALTTQQSVGRVSCSLMPGGSARRSMDLSKMGIKILVPKSPMNCRPDSQESPSEAGVQEAHLVPPEVALPEKPAGVQLGPGEERARMGSRPRNPNPSSSPAASTAAVRALGCPGESLWWCDWMRPGVLDPDPGLGVKFLEHDLSVVVLCRPWWPPLSFQFHTIFFFCCSSSSLLALLQVIQL